MRAQTLGSDPCSASCDLYHVNLFGPLVFSRSEDVVPHFRASVYYSIQRLMTSDKYWISVVAAVVAGAVIVGEAG